MSLQRKLLPEMQRAVAAGEASQSNYVLLYDRVMKGERQAAALGHTEHHA